MNKSLSGLSILLAAASLHAANPSDPAVRALDHAPLRFEPAASGFVTRGLRFSSSLNASHMDLRTRDQAMRVSFANASPKATLEPGDALRSTSNVIHGNDRSKWRTVPNYSNLRAHNLYPGIDLLYYGNHGDLEYDLIVNPPGDSRRNTAPRCGRQSLCRIYPEKAGCLPDRPRRLTPDCRQPLSRE
jgi:hypothetical protein